MYEGQPYRDLEGAGDIGTVIADDALGRVLSCTAPGAPAATWTYGPGSVTYREELGRDTVRTLSAFGDPEAARLTGLIDAGGHAWACANDAIGQLRSVQAADGTTRSWLYWPGTDRLQSESHPESGTTQFVYDTLGRLAQRTDARNTTFTYGYDGNDGVRTIAAGTEVTQIIYEAGSDNRGPCVLFDGGLGTMLMARGLTAGEAPERWNTGDSVIAAYAPHCDAVLGATNLHELYSALRQTFRTL